MALSRIKDVVTSRTSPSGSDVLAGDETGGTNKTYKISFTNLLAWVKANIALATADITGLVAALAGKADDVTTTNALAGKAASSHTHAIANVTGLQTALDGKADVGSIGGGSGLTTILASFSADGFTSVLPLNIEIVRIAYSLSGGFPTAFVFRDENNVAIAGALDSTGSVVPVTPTSTVGVLEGISVPYTSFFGRLGAHATAWNGATLAVEIGYRPLVGSVVTPAAPAVPAGLAISATHPTSLDVTASAVSYAANYEFRYSVHSLNSWTAGFSNTSPSASITGLVASTSYDIEVRARNGVGDSAWSSIVTGSTSAGVSIDTDAQAYITRTGATATSKVDAVVKLLKNQESNLSGNLWSNLRAGFLGRADCIAGSGSTWHDLTAAQRDMTFGGSVTRATTNVTFPTDTGAYRDTPGFLPASAGAACTVMFKLATAWTGDLGTVLVVPGNHNSGDANRFYLRDTSSPSRVREFGTYWDVFTYADDVTEGTFDRAITTSGANDTLFASGGASPVSTANYVGPRTLTDERCSLFRRPDGWSKPGKAYYLFFFDGAISGADYAVLSSRLATILA